MVLKRNGVLEPLDLEKMHKVVFWATRGIENVSASEVESEAKYNFMTASKPRMYRKLSSRVLQI